MTLTRIPLNLFGIAFGITGLAGTWLAAAGTGTGTGAVPGWIGSALLAVGAAVWAITLVLYTWWAARHRSAAASDLTGPITAPFASLALITPLLLAAEGVAPHARTAATILVDVFIALTIAYGAWFIGQLMGGPYDYDQLHPGFLLPTVAGG
jgi:tellurite resistance protein